MPRATPLKTSIQTRKRIDFGRSIKRRMVQMVRKTEPKTIRRRYAFIFLNGVSMLDGSHSIWSTGTIMETPFKKINAYRRLMVFGSVCVYFFKRSLHAGRQPFDMETP